MFYEPQKLCIWLPILTALEYGLLCAFIGLAAVLQNFLIIPMIRWSGPTVCSMMRRTEVLIVLLVDVAFYSIYPNATAAVGYCLVILSSCGIVLAPKVEEKWCYSKKVASDNQEDAGSNS